MPLIHIVDKQTDTILDDIRAEDVLSNEHYRSLKDTTETFEFVTFADKRFSPYLEKRNRVIIPDEDRGYAEFIVTNSIKIHEQDNLVETEVYADASYLELKKSKVIEPQTLTEYTVSMHAGFALGDTAWQLGVVESDNYRTIVIEEHTNPYAYLKRIANEFDLELNFRIEIQGSRIIGRYVDLVERIGIWRGVEVEFGKNLDGIRRNEKTKDIVTALIGLGPKQQEDENGDVPPRLEVYIEDNEALERWGYTDRNGVVRHLVDYYEVDSNDENMTIDELTQYTKTELDKRIKETVEYEGNIHDLEHVPGLQNYKLRFGDTIRIKDTKFNPPLYMEARIHSHKRNIKKKQHKQVTLGDYVEYTEQEVTAIWQQLQQEIQQKIGLYEMLEHTYDKETIDDKDSIVLGDGQEYSRNVADTAESNAKDHADSVSSEAERLAKEYADGQIDASETSILEQTVAQAVFDTTIDDIMGDLAGKADNSVVKDLQSEVADKADAVWVEGQLQLKQGSIPQQPTAPTDPTDNMLWLDTSENPHVMKRFDGLEWVKASPTEAGEIGSYTIEEVDSALNSKVSVTEYTTDMDGVISDLENHESRITQTETDITSKVERTTFEELENEVGDIGQEMTNAWSEINQNAEDITQRVGIQEFNSFTGEITDLESEFSQQADMIASKVEETTFDSVTGELGNRLTTVEQTADGLVIDVGDVRADVDDIEADFEDIEGTLSSHSTQIEANADEIALRATKDEVDTIEGRVDSAETEISANADEINSRATQTEVDNIAGRVNTAESNISQNATEIEARVEKNNVIAEINLTSETAKIQAENIELVGAVTVLSDIAGNLGNITAGTIQGVDIIGSEILQEGVDGSILLDNTGLHKLDADGQKRVSISNENWEFQGFSPAQITLNAEGGIPFSIVEGGHGLGDGFIGYIDPTTNAVFNLRNIGGEIQLQADNVNVQADFLAIDANGSNEGFILGQPHSSLQHVLTAHNLNNYMVMYPQRYAGEDVFRIRSHHQKGSYQNDLRVNLNGNLMARSFVKAEGFTVSNGSPSEDNTSDRYEFHYDSSNGNLNIISKNSSGDWFNRIQLESRGSGSGIQIWDEITSHGTRDNTVTWGGRVAMGASSARMGYVSSSRRYKLMIEEVDVDPYKILELKPKSWFDKKNTEEYADLLERKEQGELIDFDKVERIERVPGLIAEDVEEVGLPLYVEYDEYDNVGGVQYDRLWTLLIPITKDHQEKIMEHDDDIKDLQKKYDWLETENELLKQRMNKLERGVA